MTTPDGAFWELVKAECRATWCGRWRWLWWTLTLLSAVALLFVPTKDTFGLLTPVWTYLALVPLVLGSDVASFAFPGNPAPHRHWPFRALLARTVGRFLPWLLVSVPIQIAWIARISQGFWFVPSPGSASPDWDLFAVLFTLSGIIAVTFLSFTLTATVSLVFRRPHRLLVAGSVEAILLALSIGVAWILSGDRGISAGALLMLITEPLDRLLVEFNLWFSNRLGFATVAQPLDPGMSIAPAVVISTSLGLWLWIRAIIERRMHRHPYTVTPPPESRLTNGDSVVLL